MLGNVGFLSLYIFSVSPTSDSAYSLEAVLIDRLGSTGSLRFNLFTLVQSLHHSKPSLRSSCRS